MKVLHFFLLFSVYLFSSFSLFAQGSFTIRGRVLSEKTGEGLSGANIYISGTSIGATSDSYGYYKLSKLPRGIYKLTVNYIGYSEQKHTVGLSAADTTLIVRLNRKIISGPMVQVVASRARDRVTAATFSEIGKEALKAEYTTQDLPELLSDLPSTTFYSESGNGLGYNYLSIRGFDQRRISVMINGVPQNDPEDHNIYWVNFPDFTANVQNIQAQRGAGSAFYGPAAIGGSINILTNYFSPEAKFKAYIGAGSFNTQKYSLSYNTGLIADKFVLYGRASQMKSDGYRERAWINFKSYFLGAAWYEKNHNLRVHFYGGPIEDGLAYSGLPKLVNDDDILRRKNYSRWAVNESGDSIAYATDRRGDEIENFNQPHLEVLHEYQINDELTLNNTAFYIHGYGFFDYDGSWGTPEYFRLTPDNGFDSSLTIPQDALIRAYVDNRQAGWLPQITWRKGNDEITLGAELRMHRSLHWGRLQKGTDLPAGVTGDNGRHYYEYKGAKDIASVYIHQLYEWRRNLIILADLQYVFKQYHLYDERFINTEFEVPYHFVNPRMGLNYNFSPASNVYLSVSYTNREPRMKNLYNAAEASTPSSWGAVTPQFELNSDSSYNFNEPLVKPETLTGIELGYRYKSERFKSFINIYYMDFVDEIIKKGGLDRFGQPVTGNAEKTLHQGIELGGAIQILPQLSLSANGVYSQNKLVSYTVYDSDGIPFKLDGNPIAGFPDLLANVRLAYSWEGLYASLSVKHVGKFYTDNFKNEKNVVDPFTVIGLNFKYNLSNLGLKGLAVQGRISNLLDAHYLASGEGEAFFPAATRNGFIGLQFEY